MIKRLILSLIRLFGYDLVNTKGSFWYDRFPYDDVKLLFDRNKIEKPVMLDVGANKGQTIDILKLYFPKGNIHAFEPGKKSFKQLSEKYASDNISLNHVAVSSSNGVAKFFDYPKSDLSSLNKLTSNQSADSEPETYEVPTLPLDQYCEEKNIGLIHLFKTDTQGHEMDVLKGFERTLTENKVFLAFVEINFKSQYENEPPYLELWGRMDSLGFKIFRLYHARYDDNGQLLWADALFINDSFLK